MDTRPPRPITSVPTGFTHLDDILVGLRPSQLIIIAGRPVMGKTPLTMNIVRSAAMRNRRAVGVFTMETSKPQWFIRMLSSACDIESRRMQRGDLNESEWSQVTAATSEFLGSYILIDDTPALTSSELRSRAWRMKRDTNIELVVVDYLQLMNGAEHGNDSVAITGALKALAMELEIPVVAVSQLNRRLEQREDKRPILADLPKSVSIEDCDVILFVYRDEVYNPESAAKGIAELIIGKQQNGPPGNLALQFEDKFSRFTDRP